MSEFEREVPSFRLVEIHHGDDLQSVAAREMGDANRWYEIAWLNNLTPPYITTDPSVASEVPGLALAGDMLKVPAPAGIRTQGALIGEVYEKDCLLDGRLLQIDTHGDFEVARGVDNLSQQLRHRIDTPRGQLRRHHDYGCMIWRLKGRVNGPEAGYLGAEYVKSALLADYRVSSVAESVARVQGDTIRISARAIAITGSSVDLSS